MDILTSGCFCSFGITIFQEMSTDAIRRLLLSLAAGTVGFFAVFLATGHYPMSFVWAWDAFALTYIAICMIVFLRVRPDQIGKICAQEDVSTWILFSVIITACLSSLIIVLTLFNEAVSWPAALWVGKSSCVLLVVVSWIMMHLSFTFRYAHVYYGDANKRYAAHARGLDFPQEKHPDYFDFAYFAFVIGMTFQVSDVVIVSRRVRRLALLHSLIAFVFNTVIIALTVSQVVNFHNS